MTPRQWIDEVRATGLVVELLSSPQAAKYPFNVGLGTGSFAEHWTPLACALRDVGVDKVTEELHRETHDGRCFGAAVRQLAAICGPEGV